MYITKSLTKFVALYHTPRLEESDHDLLDILSVIFYYNSYYNAISKLIKLYF